MRPDLPHRTEEGRTTIGVEVETHMPESKFDLHDPRKKCTLREGGVYNTIQSKQMCSERTGVAQGAKGFGPKRNYGSFLSHLF